MSANESYQLTQANIEVHYLQMSSAVEDLDNLFGGTINRFAFDRGVNRPFDGIVYRPVSITGGQYKDTYIENQDGLFHRHSIGMYSARKHPLFAAIASSQRWIMVLMVLQPILGQFEIGL